MERSSDSSAHDSPPTSPGQGSHSCDICVEIIQQLIQPPLEVTEVLGENTVGVDLNIGWLDSVIDNKQCSLCRLIWRVYERTRPEGWIQTARIYCRGNARTRLTASGNRKDWKVDLDFLYRIGNSQHGSSIESLWQPAIQLVADDASLLELEEDVFQLGRVIPASSPDPGFMRSCIKKCLDFHGDTCTNPVRRSPGIGIFPLAVQGSLPSSMRVIDTVEYRIRPAPPSCSYAILSYVWGQTNFLKLTKANYKELTTKDALRKLKVPRTIADAMEVAKRVAFRYLWVDSVCILQDDDEEKISQIQRMDKIYSESALTIVAFSQRGADDGLWHRGETETRFLQIVEDICGLRFIGSAPLMEDLLKSSPWNRRGWTFQEFVLSRRVLFFTEYQVYFQCETAVFAEDQVHQLGVNGQAETEVTIGDDSPRNILSIDNHSTYWRNIISAYTERSLSFESDGLNAVSGVAQHHAEGMKDGVICGLLVSTLFEAGLMWHAGGSLRRRAPVAPNRHFPTWSWVGWVGKVTYENFDQGSEILDGRMIEGWVLQHDGGFLHSTDLHFPLAPGKLVSQSSPEVSDRAHQLLKSIQTGLLCFKAISAMFQVDNTYWNQFLYTEDPSCRHGGLYKIFHKDTWIGSVHLTHTMASSIHVGRGTLHEFIALSHDDGWLNPRYDSRRPGEDSTHTVEEDLLEEPEYAPLYSPHLLDHWEEKAYNVMLLSTDLDGVSHRSGVGHIHKASFDQVEWPMRDVRLG